MGILKPKKVVTIEAAPRPAEDMARANFSAHVQSVAFQISLSRRMIELLKQTRDYGFPHNDDWQVAVSHRRAVGLRLHKASGIRKAYETHDFVGPIKSLEKRGLIILDDRPFSERKKGDKYIQLSLAGEIMCELLVEAGLISQEARQ